MTTVIISDGIDIVFLVHDQRQRLVIVTMNGIDPDGTVGGRLREARRAGAAPIASIPATFATFMQKWRWWRALVICHQMVVIQMVTMDIPTVNHQ